MGSVKSSKFLAFLLTFTLVIGQLPSSAMFAWAEEDATAQNAQTAQADESSQVEETPAENGNAAGEAAPAAEIPDAAIEDVPEEEAAQDGASEGQPAEALPASDELVQDATDEGQSEEALPEEDEAAKDDKDDKDATAEEAEKEKDKDKAKDKDDPTKPYAYRLLVGFNGSPHTREGDVVLGTYGSTVLLGFDNAKALSEAQNFYAPVVAFASVDGALSASAGSSEATKLETIASAEITEAVSGESNPLSEAAEAAVPAVSAPAVIALIDTGASGANVARSASVLGESAADDNGHGTGIAATIAEENPNAQIVSIKALDANGKGSVASVYAAIKLAIESNVDYILCAFSAYGFSDAIGSVLQEAMNNGIQVVVSAGNDGASAYDYCPANVENVITVGALDETGNIAEFSNQGIIVNAWAQANSTSEAAAKVVAGLAAGKSLDDFQIATEAEDEAAEGTSEEATEFETNYKTTTDSLTDGGIYIIRLRKDPTRSLVQETGGYSNGNRFVLSSGQKREDSGAQFKLQKINYNYYFIVRDNTDYIMSPDGGDSALGTNGQVVHMWKKTSSNYMDFDQWWMKANGNYFRITNGANTGMHLQTYGSNTAGGTVCHLWNATTGEQGDWIFERVYYNVSFNGNGSTSGSMSNQKIYQEVSTALTANAFSKTGYTFKNWNTNSSGTGTSYANKKSVKTLTSTNAATVNLYAQWTANTYSVKYDGNGSTSGSMSNSSHTYDASKALTANAYAKKGYTFAGWNTKADGTGTSYANKASVKNLTATNGGTVTLYAQWAKKEFKEISDISDQTYTGNSIKPAVVVYDKAGTVVNAKEYTLSYSNNVNVGTAKVTATPVAGGEYGESGAVSENFKIVKASADHFNTAKTEYSGVYDAKDHIVKITAATENEAHAYKIGYGKTAAEAKAAAEAKTSSETTNGGYAVKNVADSGSVYYYIIPNNFEALSGKLSVSITPKELTVSGMTAKNKTYDGVTGVTLDGSEASLEGVCSGDDVSLNTAGMDGSATSKNVGTWKVVVTGLALEGESANNYMLTQPTDVTASITAKTLGLTWQDKSFAYDGTAKTYGTDYVGVNADEVVSGDDVVVGNMSGTVGTNVGSYTATVDSLSGEAAANYSIDTSSASKAWTITQAENEVTVAIDGWTYGKTANSPTSTATFGASTVEYSYSSDGETWTSNVPIDAGTYFVKAAVAATENYAGASAEVEFSIEKANITVTADDNSSVRNEELNDVTYAVSGDFVASDASALAAKLQTATTADNTKPGKYETSVGWIDSSDTLSNYEVTFATGTYTVTRNDAKVTASDYSGIYDGQAHGVSVSINDSNAVIYYTDDEGGFDESIESLVDAVNAVYDGSDEEFDAAYTTLATALEASGYPTSNPTATNVGTKAVHYIIITDHTKPDVIVGHKNIAITPAELTVTANNKNVTYGDEAANEGVEYAGFVNEETAETALDGTLAYDYAGYAVGSDVGAYSITPSGLTALNSNYDIHYVAGTLTVAPKVAEFDWSTPTEFNYNGTERTMTATLNNAVGEDAVTVAAYINNAKTAAGTYTAELTSLGGSKAKNYTLTGSTSTSCAWEIVEYENPVSVSMEDWKYGETAAEAEVSAKDDANKATVEYFTDEECQIKTSAANGAASEGAKPANAGSYYVKATLATTDKYAGSEATDSFTIEKREVTLTSATDSKVYDGSPLTNNEVTVSGDGFATGEGATYSVTGTITRKGEVVNHFIYTLNEGTLASNYTITKVEGTLTVTARLVPLEIEPEPKTDTVTYDGQAHHISGFVTNTFEVEDHTYTLSGLTASASGTDAGTHPVVISGTAVVHDSDGDDVTDEFKITPKEGALVIEPRSITLTSASDTKEYDGTPLTNDTITVGGEGFVEGEGAIYDVTGSQLVKGDSENTFTYEMNGATNAGNYNVTTVNGKLTVTPRTNKYKLVITPESGDATYNGSEQSISGWRANDAISSEGAAEFEAENGEPYVVSGITSSAKGTTVGKYPCSVTGTPAVVDEFGNDVTEEFDITISADEAFLEIEPKQVEIEWTDTELTYDGTAQMPTASITNLVEGDECELTVTGEQVNAAAYSGEDAAKVTAISNANYKLPAEGDEVEQLTCDFTIAPKEITKVSGITAGNKIYDGTSNANVDTSTATLEGLVTGDDLAVTATGAFENANAGKGKMVNISDVALTGEAVSNYTLLPAGVQTAATANIEPKTIGITWGGTEFVYDAKSHKPSATATGLVDGDEVNITVEGEQTDANVETFADDADPVYTATATGLDNSNYQLPLASVGLSGCEFKIRKAVISITADDKSSGYKEDLQELTYKTGGEINEEDLQIKLSTTATNTSPVGEYPITVSWIESENYVATTAGAKYTITQASAQVTASSYEGVYDAQPHSITVEVKDKNTGLVDLITSIFVKPPETPEATVYFAEEELTDENFETAGSTENLEYTNVGTYTVYYYVTFGGNYQSDSVSGSQTVTITPASDGSIETETVDEDNTHITVSNLDDVAENLLTPEEKQAIENGAAAKVWVEITKLDKENVGDRCKSSLSGKADELSATDAIWLDISVFKQVTGFDEVQVHETGKALSLDIAVPDDLRNADSGTTRTFYLLRCHNGEASVLGETSSEVLNGKSDRFSTFLVAYKDVKQAPGEDVTPEDEGETPKDEGITPKDKVVPSPTKTSVKSPVTKATTTAKTGDESYLVLEFMLACAALMLVAGVRLRRDERGSKN